MGDLTAGSGSYDHGGQGEHVARQFFDLLADGRIPVEAFLKSFVTPAPGEPLVMR